MEDIQGRDIAVAPRSRRCVVAWALVMQCDSGLEERVNVQRWSVRTSFRPSSIGNRTPASSTRHHQHHQSLRNDSLVLISRIISLDSMPDKLQNSSCSLLPFSTDRRGKVCQAVLRLRTCNSGCKLCKGYIRLDPKIDPQKKQALFVILLTPAAAHRAVSGRLCSTNAKQSKRTDWS